VAHADPCTLLLARPLRSRARPRQRSRRSCKRPTRGRGGDRRPHPSGVYPSVGIALQPFFDLVRLEVRKGLRNGTWQFNVDLSRDFWKILLAARNAPVTS
jgi:hypothetical protein